MFAAIRTVLFRYLGGKRFEENLSEELRFHLESRTEDLVRSGLPRQQAERQARLEFGSLEAKKEECREAGGLHWVDNLRRDLIYGIRILRKSPAFALSAILTLGLCIGANTAVFSFIDTLLLRPLPYPEPDRLAMVARLYLSGDAQNRDTPQTGRAWEIVRDHATLIDRAAFKAGSAGVNFSTGGKAEQVLQRRVGSGFFRILGINPLLGREFTREEDREGGPAVVIMSHRLWARVFNSDRSAIGRSIMLRGEPYTVIGVMPRDFQSDVPADVWTPLRPSTQGEGGGTNYRILARVKSGSSWEAADSQLRSVGEALFKEQLLPPNVMARLTLIPLQGGLTAHLRNPLIMLWASVGVVLIIGCVNIAGLLLSRCGKRTREIATRMALGSGRAAVVKQMLVESVVLALAGGAVGVGIGYLGKEGLQRLVLESLGIWQPVSLDGRILLATVCLSLLTSIVFGLVPALAATRLDLRSGLAEGGARGIAGSRSHWPRRFLVVVQVALGVVLLTAAGLLVRTFLHLSGLNPGFDHKNVITAKASLYDARYQTAGGINRLFDQTLSRVRELPGVESAAVALTLPYERPLNFSFKRLDTPQPDQEPRITDLSYVTPEYFQTLRIPVLQGRGFTVADGQNASPSVVVNQAFVRSYLEGHKAIGSHVELDGKARRVVGIVGDVQQRPGWGTTRADWRPLAPTPTMYLPAAQGSDGFFTLIHTWFPPSWVVRTAGPIQGLVAGMQRALEDVDPQLPLANFREMDQVMSRALVSQRFQASLLAALAALALLLAGVGVYGLIASSVAERTREVGIRMAMGATIPKAIRTVALPGILLTLVGVAMGSLLARVATRLLENMLWGITTTDPITFLGVIFVLLFVAAVAGFLPSRQIARLNPAETLRYE